MTIQTPGGTAAQPNEGGTPRDGDPAGNTTETSRNAADDAARDGRSDDEDELDSEDDPKALRQIIRDLRKGERKRNEGYNTLRQTSQQQASELERFRAAANAGAPAEERMKALEKELADEKAKTTRMEQERKDDRTEAGIMAAARKLNAADPEDVVRLLDRDELTIEEDGTPADAEKAVRDLLKRKPHLMKVGGSAGGGADGGSRGRSGAPGTDMNDLIRQGRSARRGNG